MDEQLMTVSEFNSQVLRWAMTVRRNARETLASETHGTGHLGQLLWQYVDKGKGDANMEGAAYKVAFVFPRYGVFRAYGAGRGWVVRNGVPTRGFRARSEKEIKHHQWNAYTNDLSSKGYTVREINRFKFYTSEKKSNKQRTPLDWIDRHIRMAAGTLADITAQFYGDQVMRKMLKALDKLTIVKNTTTP